MSENDPTSPREQMKHPAPQPDYKDALKRLLEALVRQCEDAEAVSSEAGVTTYWIRRLVLAHSARYFPD